MNIADRVAREVMDWRFDPSDRSWYAPRWDEREQKYVDALMAHQEGWNPMKFWGQAGEVLDRMRELGFQVSIFTVSGKRSDSVYFEHADGRRAHRVGELKEAICLAALVAVEDER